MTSTPTLPTHDETHSWTIKRIRDITEARFGKRPCWYQVKTALAIYEGKDVVGISRMRTHRCREDTFFLDTPLDGPGRWNGQDELCGYTTELVGKAKCESP